MLYSLSPCIWDIPMIVVKRLFELDVLEIRPESSIYIFKSYTLLIARKSVLGLLSADYILLCNLTAILLTFLCFLPPSHPQLKLSEYTCTQQRRNYICCFSSPDPLDSVVSL